jgi:hypothetical protein
MGDRQNDYNIDAFTKRRYRQDAKGATQALMEFIVKLNPNPNIPVLCITYFDEAAKLGQLLWVLLHLIGNQDSSIAMWYVFMATKSEVGYFFPNPKNREYLVYSCPSMPH